MYTFTLERPSSTADAARLAAAGGKPLAGGQTLLASMKLRLANPGQVVDLTGIRELSGIRKEGNNLVIGAMTRHAEVAASADVKSAIPALADLAGGIGDRQVRNLGTIGGSVAPGQPLVELVPTGESLLIEGRLSPKDIGFVALNQPVRVSITAYDSGVYGSLDGKVVSISPDATVDEKSGESFYVVQVRTTGVLRDSNGKPLQLGSGMMADISLLGDRRSVLSYIFTPFMRLGEHALRE